ncbi:MAG: DUF4294 domain-containing protein [Bacteroidales bacterium]
MYRSYVAIIISIIIASCFATVTADDDVMSVTNPVIKDRYYFVDIYGDTALMNIINNITVYPPEKFKSKKREQFYWRTVRDVRITLPYAKMIYRTLVETYEYIETFPTQEEREAYLKDMEHEIFEQYKPQLKRLTLSQGKLLIRLINRETNQSSYHIIKAFLGSFRAGFWQTFGRFFGANLKTEWNPEKNSDDAMIDRICTQIEQGISPSMRKY